ncbi:MAG: insulinase family protein [Deltaproteobacteria bacterium]|nr:insulinase family protein [Deltaproteobacteria bacterium]
MIQNIKTSSGLELAHFSLPHTRFVDIALAIGVGSRHEQKRLMGISHFTEHILFRGCRTLPTSYQLSLEFDRIGEGLNAMTGREFTMFTTRVPNEELARALKLLAGVVSEPLFRDVDTERGIILEEILEELDEDGKDDDLDNISRKFIFGDYPLGYPVLGRPETVKNITESELMDFHATYYLLSNMSLAVAGGASWAKCKQAVEDAFGRRFIRPAAPSSARGRMPAPARARPSEIKLKDLRSGIHFVEGSGSQVEVIFSFFIPGERAPGEMARMFLSRVLDDGISSRLQRTVCERRGLLYDISSGSESFTDVGLFDVQFSVSTQKLVEVVEVVVAELRLLGRELIGAEEFGIVRERFRRDGYSTAESARGMATLMSEVYLLRLPLPLEPREHEARINELTPQAVRDEAARAFRFDHCAFVAKGDVSPAQRRAIRRILKRLD